jgi:hypothetical protein
MQSGTAVTLPRDIDADLDHWLDPFLDATGRSTRRKMAPLYVRGLLGSGGRKSVQPMAERLGLSSHDQLHHFISSPAWDDAPLWRVLAEQVDRQVGGAGAVLVVDDSGIPKKGELSVGVARQYCGELGKVANCQVLVSLTWRAARCRCRSGCGCSCPPPGRTIRSAATRPGCRRRRARRRASLRLRWPRSTGCGRCALFLRAGRCRVRQQPRLPPWAR